ncbi:hypothetical protein [Flavobacterium sp. UMI-01]|uniref:hypothetical protein n=1 Tax=Flavobacterium sp. UMI-01 TaxID=1441053 RepID=UPI001C7D590A|nr:hypothetical protein [Flavobacterium sp. UMI-01]GIZ07825.1 hypothetical protein FUMI01_05520 [Flavobacterium sp. UMI-01]
MSSKLKASNFKFQDFYQDKTFEFILTQIYTCYTKMLNDYPSIENNENIIRNGLYKKYLENNQIRDELKLTPYLFDTEIELFNDDDTVIGRTDIKVYNAIERTKNTDCYYIIECKRIDGSNTLNKKYIENGINRYIKNEKYPSFKNVNGMIGFVVNPIDIEQNTNYFTDLKPYQFINNFKYTYISNHITTNSKNLTLYHLMLDFSMKIII